MARPIYAALLGLVLLAGCAGEAPPTSSPTAAATSPSPIEPSADPTEPGNGSEPGDATQSDDGTEPDDAAGSGATAPADDPPGRNACRSLSAAVQAATLMDPGVVDGIVRASGTADAPVADAARRLATTYAEAVTSHGTDREPDAIAAVSVAGAEMTRVCQESGLNAAG